MLLSIKYDAENGRGVAKIRFHLDENVPRTIAQQLSRNGIDVTLTPDQGLLGVGDEEQIAFGLASHRVIFTQDADLLALTEHGLSHAGIVYTRKDTRSIGQIVGYLRIIHRVLPAEEMLGAIEYIP